MCSRDSAQTDTQTTIKNEVIRHQMTSYKTKFPSKFLKAADLERSRQAVTIERWADEQVGSPPEEKAVLYFRDLQKGLVLNKTNAESIEEVATTDDMDAWVGVPIVLVRTKTDFQGKRVECIRIEAPEEFPVSA